MSVPFLQVKHPLPVHFSTFLPTLQGQFQMSVYQCSVQSLSHVIPSYKYALTIQKLLCVQSCLTLCNSVDCSSPSSLSMEFSRQECWNGLPFSPPGDLPNLGIEPRLLHRLSWQADSLPLEPPGKLWQVRTPIISCFKIVYVEALWEGNMSLIGKKCVLVTVLRFSVGPNMICRNYFLKKRKQLKVMSLFC